jgi:hypothetical protein
VCERAGERLRGSRGPELSSCSAQYSIICVAPAIDLRSSTVDWLEAGGRGARPGRLRLGYLRADQAQSVECPCANAVSDAICSAQRIHFVLESRSFDKNLFDVIKRGLPFLVLRFEACVAASYRIRFGKFDSAVSYHLVTDWIE